MPAFRRVLVANRGEIAVRIVRTLRELGITSIAVFSEPDRAAFHVLQADEAYLIGPGPARESYLDLGRVIETAKRVGADAVHPGYGFFAENAAFARACEEAGMVFIGPRPETLAALGDKLAARAIARRVGVPVIPGSPGPVESIAEVAALAREIGWPLMLKAAAGGGGKGMRIVRSEAELESAWTLTRGEAQAAFGEAACRIARAAGYLNAGTVEFILDEQKRFYFLEVNTRLQVEHPVTEMVTGLDLVAEQVRIAQGEPLSFGDRPPEPRGWSIEARILAEDPAAGFLPSIGRLSRLRFPHGPGVRTDGGIYRGCDIPVFYDSLLTKLVVHGTDREQARRRLLRALHEFVIEGVHTNLTFHRWLASHPAFVAGDLSTRFLEEHFRPEVLKPGAEVTEAAVLAAALHARAERVGVALPAEEAGPRRSAWRWSARPGEGEPR